VNLAAQDVRRNLGRFFGTCLGIALLFTVVLAMAGIYEGLVADATVLLRSMRADLWVVQRGTRGPFADTSRIDPSLETRVASVEGVRRARAFTYQVLQREHGARSLRFALVGVSWPDDAAGALRIVAGRPIEQARGELVADASLGLPIGTAVELAGEELRVVGVTRQVLASSGDAVVFATIADAQQILADAPHDALRSERERRAGRLRATDIGRQQPALENLALDPDWQPPALGPPPIAAVLVDVANQNDLFAVRAAIASWPDVTVYSSAEQERLLLDGVVEKPRRQLGLFSAILVLTSSVLMGAIIYTMTLDKAHSIAVLKLMGAGRARIAALVLEQAWAMGIVGYAAAVAIGSLAFPYFPRRVVLTAEIIGAVGGLVLVISTLASLLGVAYALRVDAGRALEA
jgi:putative ABC transport system permease protein